MKVDKMKELRLPTDEEMAAFEASAPAQEAPVADDMEQKRQKAKAEIAGGNTNVTAVAKAANISRKAARRILKEEGAYKEQARKLTREDIAAGRCTEEERVAFLNEQGPFTVYPVNRDGTTGEGFTHFAFQTPERRAQGWELTERQKQLLAGK